MLRARSVEKLQKLVGRFRRPLSAQLDPRLHACESSPPRWSASSGAPASSLPNLSSIRVHRCRSTPECPSAAAAMLSASSGSPRNRTPLRESACPITSIRFKSRVSQPDVFGQLQRAVADARTAACRDRPSDRSPSAPSTPRPWSPGSTPPRSRRARRRSALRESTDPRRRSSS